MRKLGLVLFSAIVIGMGLFYPSFFPPFSSLIVFFSFLSTLTPDDGNFRSALFSPDRMKREKPE